MTQADSSYYEPYQDRPYNPHELFRKKGNYDLYDEMRQDDQISPLLYLKKYIILNSEWKVVSENPDVEEYFNEVGFKQCDRHLYSYFLEMLTMFDYGLSLTEPVFALEDFKKYGQKVVLKTLKTRPPHTFTIPQDSSGKILSFDQYSSGGDIKIKPERLIHLTNKEEFDVPYGNSDLSLGVYRAWFSKKIIIKFLNIYLERYGSPTIWAKYKTDTLSSKEKAALKNIINNISARSGFMTPDKIDLSLLQGRNSDNPFIESINQYNLQIARALMTPDLSGYSGSETSGGSYALGKEQFDSWYMTLELSKKILLRAFNQQVFRKLVAWNFGEESAATSYFTLLRINNAEKETNAKIWIDAVKSGKVKPIMTQVNTFLKSIDYPELTEEQWDEQEEERKTMSINMQNNLQGGDDDSKGHPGKPNEAKEKPDDTEDDDKKDKFVFTPTRAKTEAEEKVDFAMINDELDTLDEKHFKSMKVVFSDALQKMVSFIERKKIIENKRLDLVNELDVPDQAKIKAGFKSIITDAYKAGKASATAESVEHRADKFAVGQVQTIKDIVSKFTDWVKFKGTELLNIERMEILKKSTPIISNAIQSGLGVRETVKQLDDVLKGYDKPRTEMVVRTNINNAFNQGRLDIFSQDPEIQGYEISAILDSRTSAICQRLDGKQVSKADVNNWRPPFHGNCRTIIVPVFNDEKFSQSKMPTLSTEQSAGTFKTLAKEK